MRDYLERLAGKPNSDGQIRGLSFARAPVFEFGILDSIK
jgi:hypothetical protein